MSGAGPRDIVSVLGRLGLVEPGTADCAIVEEGEWIPGGAETYSLRFRVETGAGSEAYLLKSVVAFGGGGVGQTGNDWLARRTMLDRAGVRVPRLFAFRKATFLEEYVPRALREVVQRDAGVADTVRAECIEVAGTIGALGFRPVSLFADARSHGRDVVLVDFGADLGPALEPPELDWALSSVERYFGSVGWSMTDGERRRVRRN